VSATARKNASSSRKSAVSAVARAGDVAIAEIDDILGEIGVPAIAGPEDGRDVVGDISGPETASSLDDILREFGSSAPLEPPAESLDEVLSEIAPAPKPEPKEDLDDILGELAPAAKAEPADSLDDTGVAAPGLPARVGRSNLVGDLAKQTEAKQTEAQQTEASDSDDAFPEVAAVDFSGIASEPEPPAEMSRVAPATFAGAVRLPSLSGTRQISRRAHLGLIGLVGLFGLTAAAETAFILVHGAGSYDTKPRRMVVTLAPVDYAHIDLTRYVGKRRALREGGRDVLRNEAIKVAVLELENGEDIYRAIRDLARRSPAADRLSIADDRLTVASCDAGVCGDKSFRLVYDLAHKHASVCMTEKYLNNSYISYNYDEVGYTEVARCG
jgi:hypothetical protein